MAGECRQILEEEIKELTSLQELMTAERESIIAMDRDRLLEFARKKEASALNLKGLSAQRRQLEETAGYTMSNAEEKKLSEIRDTLLREVEAKNRIQQEILNKQMDQVENMLAFFRHFQDQSTVYDRKGKLR